MSAPQQRRKQHATRRQKSDGGRGRGAASAGRQRRARGEGQRGNQRRDGQPEADSELRGSGLRARVESRLRAHREGRAAGAAALESETQGEDTRSLWPRRIARAGLTLGLTAGVAWALLMGGREVYEYATTSARFEAKHLIYEPTAHVDDETLRALLAIDAGTNILALEPTELGARLAQHPWVAEASVTRELPDTLEIEIVEHVPEALLLAGGFYLVNAEGRPFKALERGEGRELPIITGVDRELLAAEAGSPERAQAITEVGFGLELLHTYQAKQRPRLGEIHLDEDGSVTLYTAESGTALHLGRDDFEARLERWDALRVALGDRAERLAVVHLDHESKPDRRDRVVARFAREGDDEQLLAQAAPRRGNADSQQPAQAIAAPTVEAPAQGAGRRNRIPRYQ